LCTIDLEYLKQVLGTHLFVKVPRDRRQRRTFSVSQTATCFYQSNHS